MENSKILAVLTGDIVNSRKGEAASWMLDLKSSLNLFGKEPLDWEIYRGDSFQLLVPAMKALYAAILIKAALKQFPKLDVRIAIGIGNVSYRAAKITEASGDAFLRSGACFDALKKQTLRISSENDALNECLNLMFELAQLTMNSWSVIEAQTIHTALLHPDKSQLELAQILGKSQSSVSEALNRGGFEEILKMERYYQQQILSV